MIDTSVHTYTHIQTEREWEREHRVYMPLIMVFCGLEGKESAMQETWVWSLGRSPGGGHGNSLQYACMENLHGQRILVVYSQQGCEESDTTERLSTPPENEGQDFLAFLYNCLLVNVTGDFGLQRMALFANSPLLPTNLPHFSMNYIFFLKSSHFGYCHMVCSLLLIVFSVMSLARRTC